MTITTRSTLPPAGFGQPSSRLLVLAACLGWLLGIVGTPPLAAQDETSGSKKGGLSWDFLDPGTFELSLSVSGSFSDVQKSDAEETTIGGSLLLGFLLNPWLELGVKGQGSWSDSKIPSTDPLVPGSVKTVRYDVLGGPVIIVNLPTDSRLVPFATVSGGAVYTKFERGDENESELGAYWDGGGGVRFFLTPFASVNVTVLFRQMLFGDQPDVNEIVGTLGLSLFF